MQNVVKLPVKLWNNQEELKIIKNIFAPKLNNLEFEFFVELGKATNLNPFLREIWAVKYAENSSAQIFIGRDGYRKAAQANKNYASHQVDAVYSNDDFQIVDGRVSHNYKLENRGKLLGAYCLVWKKNQEIPIFNYVEFEEYSTNKGLWRSAKDGGKPATMIKKVAEAQALRMCFQEIFAGSYCPEEMEKGISQNTLSKTDELKQVINIDLDTGEVLEQLSEEQLIQIKQLIEVKEISKDRLNKAFEYYKIKDLKELTKHTAEKFINNLRKL